MTQSGEPEPVRSAAAWRLATVFALIWIRWTELDPHAVAVGDVGARKNRKGRCLEIKSRWARFFSAKISKRQFRCTERKDWHTVKWMCVVQPECR